MEHNVTRQILWNVSLSFEVLLYLLLMLLLGFFVYVGRQWYRIVRLGSKDAPQPRKSSRLLVPACDSGSGGFDRRDVGGGAHRPLPVAN